MQNEEIEKIKRKLNSYKLTCKMIVNLERQIYELAKMIGTTKSGQITGMPRGGVAVSFVDRLADLDELEEKKKRLEKLANQEKEVIQEYIKTVDSEKHRQILTMFYVNRFEIRDIAKIEDCTERHVWRLYKEAIEKVDLSIGL